MRTAYFADAVEPSRRAGSRDRLEELVAETSDKRRYDH